MPQARPKPSEIAVEAKKTYIPYIEQRMPECPVRSFLHEDGAMLCLSPTHTPTDRPRVAVIEGDPVNVALGWYEENVIEGQSRGEEESVAKIPVVNQANEKRAGGDWESGLLAPEENFARRSNLVHALITLWETGTRNTHSHYPLPHTGGVYSPYVVVYRDGPDHYKVWQKFRSLPVISVAPVRRPKLDESGMHYSFEQEKDLMLEKMRTILRIAAAWGHREICLGAFGVGPTFRNPAAEIARMWRKLLFQEREFKGAFRNIVFAIDGSLSGSTKAGESDYGVFKQEFAPSNIFPSKLALSGQPSPSPSVSQGSI